MLLTGFLLEEVEPVFSDRNEFENKIYQFLSHFLFFLGLSGVHGNGRVLACLSKEFAQKLRIQIPVELAVNLIVWKVTNLNIQVCRKQKTFLVSRDYHPLSDDGKSLQWSINQKVFRQNNCIGQSNSFEGRRVRIPRFLNNEAFCRCISLLSSLWK